MNYSNVIKLVVGAVAMLIMTVGIVIPIIESSAYDVIDNGESDGMTYTYYSSEELPTETYIFSKTVDSWTLVYGSVTMTGDLTPMLVFGTDLLCAYIDHDLSLKLSYSGGIPTDKGNSFSWNIRNNSLFLGATNYGSPEFIVAPDVNGNIGSYSRSAYLEDGAFTLAVSSNGFYWNGSIDHMTYENEINGYEISFNRTGNKLNSVSWTVGEVEDPEPYVEIERESIIDLASEVGTYTIAVTDWDGNSLGYSVNATLYSDNTYRLNYFTGDAPYPSFMDITYNGQTYSPKIIGDGTGSIFRNITISEGYSAPAHPSIKIINDRAFFGESSFNGLDLSEPLVLIGDSAFEGTNFWPENYGYSLNVQWIGDRAFYGTPCNAGLNLDYTIHIGDSAFFNTNVSFYGVSGQMNYLGDSAFENCSKVIVPYLGYADGSAYVEWIGDSAFEGCGGWTDEYDSSYPLEIYSQTVHIGDRAFANAGVTTVNTSSSGEWGEDVFADNPLVSVINTGGVTLTESNIGVPNASIQNGVTSPFFTAIIYDTVEKEGLVYGLILLLPMFVLIGLVVGIAVESVRRQ